jgi:hypothetical protein
MIDNLRDTIVKYIYAISKQPVKLVELLEANQLFNEGMKLDGNKLGFRIKLLRAYLVFLLLAHIFIIPVLFATHTYIEKLNCHFAILLAIFLTAWLFGIFSFFKEWTRDGVAKIRIKQAWKLHFPYFPYDEFNQQINTIFEEAQKQEIHKQDLEAFILDKLSQG